MKDEKYLILNNAHQFYAILRCSRRTLEDYINYGKATMLKSDGSLDLLRLSDWLTTRGVSHRAQLSEEKNPVLRMALRRDVKKLNRTATKNRLFISDEELAYLLNGIDAGQFDLCWNTAGLMK